MKKLLFQLTLVFAARPLGDIPPSGDVWTFCVDCKYSRLEVFLFSITLAVLYVLSNTVTTEYLRQQICEVVRKRLLFSVRSIAKQNADVPCAITLFLKKTLLPTSGVQSLSSATQSALSIEAQFCPMERVTLSKSIRKCHFKLGA